MGAARMSDGIARSGFDIDLRHGKSREDAFAHVLQGATVEVKSDGACRRTGNLFVEYRQKGRPSGIAVTTADYWAFEYFDDCWLLIPTERLRAVARRVWRDHHGRRQRGGDFNRYEGVLVPIAWLLPQRGLVKV